MSIITNKRLIEYSGALIALGYGFFIYLSDWPHIWDISLWDESTYLANGIYFWDPSRMSHHESSPLYSYLYKILGHFVGEPQKLFQLMGLLVSAGATISIFLCVLLLSRNLLLATAIFAILIFSNFGMVIPRLVYAAVIILMIGSSVAFSLKLIPARATVLTLTAYLTAYIRPEFALAFYILASIAAISWTYNIISFKRNGSFISSYWVDVAISGGCLIIIALLMSAWSIPTIKGDERALIAFGQHYALYWNSVHQPGSDAYLNWQGLLAENFPGAKSELDALIKFPKGMLDFLFGNIKNLFNIALQEGKSLIIKYSWFFLILLSVVAFGLRPRPREIPSEQNRYLYWSHTINALLCLALASPVLISIILIYPRQHYLIVLVALIFLYISLIAKKSSANHSVIPSAILAIAFSIFVVPAPSEPKPIIEVIKSLRNLHRSFGLVLEADGGWCYYMPRRCTTRFIQHIPTDQNVIDYIASEGIDSILVSPLMTAYAKAYSQHDLQHLLEDPPSFGWHKTDIFPDVYLIEKNGGHALSRGGALFDDPKRFVRNISLGDQFGVVASVGHMSLFVHPGMSTNTSFDFHAGDFILEAECQSLKIRGYMDERIPKAALDRGAGSVNLAILKNADTLSVGPIHHSVSHDFVYDPSPGDILRIIVDNAGNSDTDWLILHLEPDACQM